MVNTVVRTEALRVARTVLTTVLVPMLTLLILRTRQISPLLPNNKSKLKILFLRYSFSFAITEES